MRVVIDTNVIVSAFFFGGLPDKFLDLAIDKKIKTIASPEILTEYKDTCLGLTQSVKRRVTGKTLTEILNSFEIITTQSTINACRDPDDDKFIACAVDGKCKYVVSGDNDLLDIKHVEGVEIITVRKFMDEYYWNSAE